MVPLDERADHGTEAARAYPDRQSRHRGRFSQRGAESVSCKDPERVEGISVAGNELSMTVLDNSE
jgi:hypothetical protein